ncbi:MAG: PepSY-associated TM helix domain-containing protein [Bryobacteraceae bacterium]
MFRKILFWSHLIAGVLAGVIILIMSVTGVLLMYEKQIVAYVDRSAAGPGMASAVNAPESARMGVEALLANVRSVGGAVPSNITLRADPQDPFTVTVDRETVMVNPATGQPISAPPAGVRAFFRFVTDWHRWLGVTGENRANARMITGVSNLLFLFIVVSGLYIWLPRVWTWNSVRAVTLFRGGLSGKARDFNWHNFTGFWCLVPLFFVVMSGVVISYPWASNMVYRAYGMEAPSQGKGKGKGGESRQVAEANLAGIDVLVAEAKTQVPEWRTITFPIPTSDKAPLVFAIDTGSGGQPQKKSTLTLDRATGSVVKFETFDKQEPGRQARTWMRFVHTGEYYGLTGQTIAGIVSAGGALLVWTGLALAYRRFRVWLARR